MRRLITGYEFPQNMTTQQIDATFADAHIGAAIEFQRSKFPANCNPAGLNDRDLWLGFRMSAAKRAA